MHHPQRTAGQLRLLVAIACYGQKNLHLLKGIIRQYQSLDLQVDIVVLSEAPKDLGPGVEVRVGLPCGNPWSLPFGHKPLFAQRADQYDLFVYSEDDMAPTRANIQGFLRATPRLAADEIAGFLRYEVNGAGAVSLPDVHGSAHWKPESVKRRGEYTVAEFTNEHAAFYLLTQSQLKRAISSGGFLREPYEGRYDMLCAAATDPYTSCGFRKVICISHLEDFLIHHASNAYCNRTGVPLVAFKGQIRTLERIRDGSHPVSNLCNTESKMMRGKWSKGYYEQPTDTFLNLVPQEAKTVLSVGCGWGALEARLQKRGCRVTAIPLDSVIGQVAAALGLEMIYGSWEEALGKLGGRKFGAVLVPNLLHLHREPEAWLRQCARLVEQGGALVIQGYNFDRLQTAVKRTLGLNDCAKLGSFEQSGIRVVRPQDVKKWSSEAGLRVTAVQWSEHLPLRLSRLGQVNDLGRLTAAGWLCQARR